MKVSETSLCVIHEYTAVQGCCIFFQVKITLQKLAVLASPPHLASKINNNESLVKIVSGERLNIPQPSLNNVVHGVLYLTLDVSQDSAQAKVSTGDP